MTKKQDQKFNKSELKLLNLLFYYVDKSPSKTVYLTLEFLCISLGITARQLRTVRKEISHIFNSKWRKATKIDGIIRKNVYVFKVAQNNLGKTSELESPKLPISNKEEKNFNKNIDLGSESSLNLKKEKSKNPFVFDKPKNLSEMLPLITNEICDELRSKSGRPFSNNFIIRLVLKMFRKPNVKATFNYLKGFIAYMVKVLQYEKHDAVKTGNVNFKFKDNIPVNNNEQQETPEPLKLPDGVWGDICQKLVDIHGQYLYKNWFSKLTPVINEETKTLEIKASNSFVQQWIDDNYKNIIEKITVTMGLKFKEIIL